MNDQETKTLQSLLCKFKKEHMRVSCDLIATSKKDEDADIHHKHSKIVNDLANFVLGIIKQENNKC